MNKIIIKKCIYCQTIIPPREHRHDACQFCRVDGPYYPHQEMQIEAPQPELPLKEGKNDQ